MSRRRFSASVLCLSLAAAGASARALPHAAGAQSRAARPAAPPSKIFREARAADAAAGPAAFEFELGGFAYHVRTNGNGRRTKGAKARGFNLRLDRGDSVARLFYAELEGDLLFLLHLGGAGGGAGLVTRLEQPSMRGRWRQRIAAPDVGEPLREGRYLYVTAAGFVGKLDLRAGEYAWELDGLEDVRGEAPRPLNAFDEPELDGDAVLFRERPVYNPRRTLVIDKRGGKIIRVE